MRLTFLFIFIAGLLACKNQQSTETSEGGVSDGKHFGEMITEDGALSYDEFIMKMGEADSLEVKISGLVGEVCQAKGCWMNVGSETNAEAEKLFVQFKDYGFFMPKDLSGKVVVMQGKAYRELTSVEDLRHFAEDEGKTLEEIALITEPVTELKFMASGVVIKD
ncbi:MAG: DUF4920 domain-containing protein [Saprospiraceae bacterium]|nr:DUF4920 domain-containing protein [Saprospiraceae bacterium]